MRVLAHPPAVFLQPCGWLSSLRGALNFGQLPSARASAFPGLGLREDRTLYLARFGPRLEPRGFMFGQLGPLGVPSGLVVCF